MSGTRPCTSAAISTLILLLVVQGCSSQSEKRERSQSAPPEAPSKGQSAPVSSEASSNGKPALARSEAPRPEGKTSLDPRGGEPGTADERPLGMSGPPEGNDKRLMDDLGVDPNEQRALLAEIKRLGGRFELDLATRAVTLIFADRAVEDTELSCLKGLGKLRGLTLRGFLVTDAGLHHVKGLTHLQTLDLHFTGVTDAGLTAGKSVERILAVQARPKTCWDRMAEDKPSHLGELLGNDPTPPRPAAEYQHLLFEESDSHDDTKEEADCDQEEHGPGDEPS